ncbi:MAG: AMP-binding protein, partial [Proteobacteria bacterium]|nr:AMP-binding protein [Pseudomonadota bacterium]
LYLRNDFEFFEASLAASRLGAYATPVNWHFTADEAGYILRDSGARAVIAHTDLFATIAATVPPDVAVLLVPTPPEIRGAYGLPDNPAGERDPRVWEALVEANDPLSDPPRPARASMIYTSGTTGRPKGVRRGPATPQQVAANAARMGVTFGLKPGGPSVVLMNGPMYHSAPNAYGMFAMRISADIVLQPRFDPEELLALIERHRVTNMHIVPTMFVRLLRLPEAVRRRYDVSSLRSVVHGAAPCPPEVKRAMIEWWGPVIVEYYGSTESSVPTIATSADFLRKPGSVGRVLPDSAIKILDEAGNEVPQGAVGEIYIHVDGLTDFTYHNAPDKRREIGHGKFVTVGDAGYFDADGYLYLTDRKRDMVISGGVNIYPAEIEMALIGMPGVKDCAVFGLPDTEFGECLCACIQPDGAPPTADAIRAFLGQTLAKFKLPRRIEFVDAMPREDSGKIFKRKLRERFL